MLVPDQSLLLAYITVFICFTHVAWSTLTFGSSAAKYAVQRLPGVEFHIPASWAGQIPIPGTSSDELFFWLFEAEDSNYSDNLISERICVKCLLS